MGSGFALQVKLMYPKAYERYLDAYERTSILGSIMFVRQDKDLLPIVNMRKDTKTVTGVETFLWIATLYVLASKNSIL